MRLTGRAPPDAIVRLLSPDGHAEGSATDAKGAWTLELPAAETPRLFALSADLPDGHTLRGEGAVAVLPAGSAVAALTARAGAPAVAAIEGGGPVRLVAVDFDDAGGVAAAGGVRAGVSLRMMVDGIAMGAGPADAAGRFGLLGVRGPLMPGVHHVRVEGAGGASEAVIDTAPSGALAEAFRARRVAQGWRVDWSPPGGGVQSFVALDAAATGGTAR